MVMLCFVLDLPSLSPPLLRDLKQSLLHLANFYAISSRRSERRQSQSLADGIGLCYVLFNRISGSDELKIAYTPRGNFSIRDFHHAVDSLPSDAFSPQFNHSATLCSRDVKLSSILSDEVLYLWGGKDIMRKVIFLSSCLVEKMDSDARKSLMDAADKCVTVEFVLLEQKSSHIGDVLDGVNNFIKHISDLENCSFQICLPDVRVMSGLVRQWLLELKEDMEDPVQAHFIFKANIIGSVNQISCSLSRSVNHVIDGFSPCKTCRCHGVPLDDVTKKSKGSPSCPVTGRGLGTFDLIENSVKIGEQSILFLPSFQSCMKLQQFYSSISFNIIERINLSSLSEGVLIGTSHFVTPSDYHEIEASFDEIDKFELNTQLFKGLCCALHSLDQGLICSSNCNVETMMDAPFHCYYVLQPSDKGLLLLRRLAGSEEFLPVPNINHITDTTVTKEIEESVQASLLMMELRDYNPLLHERGFHQKLDLLVKNSLQFRSLPYKETTLELNSPQPQPDSFEVSVLSKSAIDLVVKEDEITQLEHAAKENRPTERITEEWEQLVVPKIHSPNCDLKPKLEQLVLSPPDGNKKLGVKTSRILERLEAPLRQLKPKLASPLVTSSSVTTDASMLTKKPSVPFQPIHIHVEDQGPTIPSSQPMKPNFRMLKRKRIS
ncbi:uncharacterized protein LOC131143927 isoform X2 [Malania oleifera]|uniref:uncharacterized protein LOC131143927 isoform X2 n=1 Tax=Malania oleifera TaxID=397392 RepID=UPI0025ADFE08|nr:uncharacterized protein LOC131143927 isoform X2 [Malania oleifera]